MLNVWAIVGPLSTLIKQFPIKSSKSNTSLAAETIIQLCMCKATFLTHRFTYLYLVYIIYMLDKLKASYVINILSA